MFNTQTRVHVSSQFVPIATDIIESLLERYRESTKQAPLIRSLVNDVFEKRKRLTMARIRAEGMLVQGMVRSISTLCRS